MRLEPLPQVEAGRITSIHPQAHAFLMTAISSLEDGNNGHFLLRYPETREMLHILASDGGGWEHISVSVLRYRVLKRCPTWEEMCYVKNLFWDPHELVVQYHPPEEEYVNNHPYVLHLWKSLEETMPMPPSIFVGFKKRRR